MTMIATCIDTLADWSAALVDVRVKPEDVNLELVKRLEASNLKPADLCDESFHGYYEAPSEAVAAEVITREMAALNMLQEFLDTCIDWTKAWEVLKEQEGYFLHKSADGKSWGLFAI